MGITTPLHGVPRRGARRHQRTAHAARDVERLRDARQRRHPPRPDRDPQGRLPRRRGRRARAPRGQPGDLRRRRLHGRRRDEGDARLRDRRRPRHPAARRPARPGPPRSSRRLVRRLHAATSRPRSGSATPTRATPMPGLRRRPRGADLARLHDGRARRQPCDDFPAPQNPADLSSYSSCTPPSYASSTTTTDGYDRPPTTTTPAPTGGDTNGDGYPDDAYAPGIQGNGGN